MAKHIEEKIQEFRLKLEYIERMKKIQEVPTAKIKDFKEHLVWNDVFCELKKCGNKSL